MQRQTQQRLIAIGIVLVIALALFLGAQALGNREDTTDAEPTPTIEVLDPLYPEASQTLAVVTALTVTDNRQGESVTVEQVSAIEEGMDTEEDTPANPLTLRWRVAEAPEDTDTGLGADTDAIQGAVAGLPSLTPTRRLTDIEGAVGDYGLDDPLHTIEFVSDFGPTYTLQVGSRTPTGAGYYVQVPDDPAIYIVDALTISTIIDWTAQPPYVQPAPDPDATVDPGG
ncbi:MAG: DUF4340 domain-containing protein [Anaerolineae bacterium]